MDGTEGTLCQRPDRTPSEPELTRRHPRRPVVSVSPQAVAGLAAERVHTPHNLDLTST